MCHFLLLIIEKYCWSCLMNSSGLYGSVGSTHSGINRYQSSVLQIPWWIEMNCRIMPRQQNSSYTTIQSCFLKCWTKKNKKGLYSISSKCLVHHLLITKNRSLAIGDWRRQGFYRKITEYQHVKWEYYETQRNNFRSMDKSTFLTSDCFRLRISVTVRVAP